MAELQPLRETSTRAALHDQAEPEVKNLSDLKLLSCTHCRQRKIKCDKSNPCTACKRLGIDCVLPKRTRVPRGRQGRRNYKSRDDELLRRIRKLEVLVEKMGGDRHNPLISGEPSSRQTTTSFEFSASILGNKGSSNLQALPTENRTLVENKYISGDFWANLGGEVDGLRSLLEQPVDDDDENDDEEVAQSTPSTTDLKVHSSLLDFVFHGADSRLEHVDFPISYCHFKALTNTYFTNVDPIFKILHRPTTLSSIANSTSNFSAPPDNSVTELLMLCMFFAAVTSLSPEECQQTFHQDSQTLLTKFRRGAELSLAREDLLITNEFAVLQAFAIYLFALRVHSKTQSTWTLFALVLRIAQSFGIHKDADGINLSIFEAQQRSLLWWQIMILDVRCAEDRGTQPMIFDGSFNTSMPLNINDDDYGPETSEPVPEFPGLTDMTLSHVTHKLAFTFRKLLFPNQISFTEKEQMIKSLSLELESLYFQKCDANVPIQWYLSMVGRLLILKMWLSLRYPLQAQDQPIYSNTTPDQTLRTAVLILQIMNMYENNPKSSQFKWVGRTWVQWHPLAVVLAELCIQTKGPLVDRAWTVVESVWNTYGERVADTTGGILWKPLKRLLKKAQAAYQEAATKREVQIEDIAAKGIAQPLPDPMFDLGQMATDEYNTSLLLSSCAPVDLQVPPWHNFDTPYNMIPIPQNTINTDYGDQTNWAVWQRFLMDSEVPYSIEENAFEVWPLASNTP
ncbi:fungal-specific transcription factor domain-containing protein [Talaromyces proteolyticus]|uniref:Fungal-specific transcription factor domain-containing protein n=1 Tax=Talaromyces proteolyticus TaxID=1131652 RepID=A0AAD4KJ14_9EURO|nr:fungal-specific transcription factor domain-containing protein [Talaromyces proteolyticus]KAH8693660.1 fungal-specific transcription factor domain-containing protein [Talaromyces proteolyticus]